MSVFDRGFVLALLCALLCAGVATAQQSQPRALTPTVPTTRPDLTIRRFTLSAEVENAVNGQVTPGAEAQVRCVFRSPFGVVDQLPGFGPIEDGLDLGLALSVDGDAAQLGPQARFGYASTRVRFPKAGSFTFNCTYNRARLRDLEVTREPTTITVADAAPRQDAITASGLQLSGSTGDERRQFEAGSTLRALLLTQDRFSRPVSPAQSTFRLVRGAYETCAPSAPEQAADVETPAATPERGRTEHIWRLPATLAPGPYSVFADFTDTAGGATCQAAAFTATAAAPPEVRILRPDVLQLASRGSTTWRVEGEAEDIAGVERVMVATGEGAPVEAQLFPGQTPDRPVRFVAEIPWRAGLHLITVTAVDGAGLTAVDAKAVTLGAAHLPLPRAGAAPLRGEAWLSMLKSGPHPGGLALRLGPDLFWNETPGLDSVQEALDLAVEGLPTDFSEYVEGIEIVVEDRERIDAMVVTETVLASTVIIPLLDWASGSGEFLENFGDSWSALLNPGARVDLSDWTIRAQLNSASVFPPNAPGGLGAIVATGHGSARGPVTCDSDSFLDNVGCTVGAEGFDDHFNIYISNALGFSADWGLTYDEGLIAYIDLASRDLDQSLRVRNNAAAVFGLVDSIRDTINDQTAAAVRAEVPKLVRDAIDEFAGCKRRGVAKCTPENERVWVETAADNPRFPVKLGVRFTPEYIARSASLPDFGAGIMGQGPTQVSAILGFTSQIGTGADVTALAAVQAAAPVKDLPLGVVLDQVDGAPQASGFPLPDMVIAGGGPRQPDITAALHVNLLNQTLAAVWQAGAFDLDASLADILAVADQRAAANRAFAPYERARRALQRWPMVDLPSADEILRSLRLTGSLTHPPRLMRLPGTTDFYLEFGDVQWGLEGSGPASLFIGEVRGVTGFIAKAELQPLAQTQWGLSVRLTDPRACPTPSAGAPFNGCGGVVRTQVLDVSEAQFVRGAPAPVRDRLDTERERIEGALVELIDSALDGVFAKTVQLPMPPLADLAGVSFPVTPGGDRVALTVADETLLLDHPSRRLLTDPGWLVVTADLKGESVP